MAIRTLDLGPIQRFLQFDDADLYDDGDGYGLRIDMAPTADNHVVRKQDLADAVVNPLVDEPVLMAATTGSDFPNKRTIAVANGIKKTDAGAGSTLTVEIDATAKPNMGGSTNSDHVDIDADNKALRLGADQDATILYDGTDLIVDPQAVGSGKMTVDAPVNTTAHYQVDGVQVVGDQQPAVTDSTDNTTGTPAADLVDVTTLTVADPVKVNDNFATLLALVVQYGDALRAHGLIDT